MLHSAPLAVPSALPAPTVLASAVTVAVRYSDCYPNNGFNVYEAAITRYRIPSPGFEGQIDLSVVSRENPDGGGFDLLWRKDWEFKVAGVSPGPYRLRVNLSQRGSYTGSPAFDFCRAPASLIDTVVVIPG